MKVWAWTWVWAWVKVRFKMRISPNGLDLRKVCVKFSVKVIGLCFGLTDDKVWYGQGQDWIRQDWVRQDRVKVNVNSSGLT